MLVIVCSCLRQGIATAMSRVRVLVGPSCERGVDWPDLRSGRLAKPNFPWSLCSSPSAGSVDRFGWFRSTSSSCFSSPPFVSHAVDFISKPYPVYFVIQFLATTSFDILLQLTLSATRVRPRPSTILPTLLGVLNPPDKSPVAHPSGRRLLESGRSPTISAADRRRSSGQQRGHRTQEQTPSHSFRSHDSINNGRAGAEPAPAPHAERGASA